MRGSEPASQSQSVPTIADLIQARRAERGWSYRTLADRADHVFSAQRWQQLGTGVRIKEFPEPATIQAMADALEVDVASVVLAAAASIGLPVERRQSELAAMLPSNADDLTEEQRDAVLAVIRAMTPKENRHDSGTEEVPEPRTKEGSTKHGGPTGGGRSRRSPSMNPAGLAPVADPDPDYAAARKGYEPSPVGHNEVRGTQPSTTYVDSNQDMPDPDTLNSREILAARDIDDASSVYPEDGQK